ncbi:MAG: hypothetical protein ACRCR2_04605 [Fusobacteriaceae bacterium]
MSKGRNTLYLFLLISFKVFSVGIDEMNFYLEKEEKSAVQTYLEYEIKGDRREISWDIVRGTSEIGEKIFIDYKIERKYELKNKIKGWENEFALYKRLSDFKILGKDWSHDYGVLVEYERDEGPESLGFDTPKERIYSLRYRMRNFAKIGMGGTYWGGDFLFSKGENTLRDGYGVKIKFLAGTKLGYGLQNNLQISNEYLDYGKQKGAYLLRIENTLRWTYELDKNWAFSLENNLDWYNYTGNTSEKGSIKIELIPYIQYSQNINYSLRVFGKISLGGYSYTSYKSETFQESESSSIFKGGIGIEYIW